MTQQVVRARPDVLGALKAYRIMAFVTGFMLLAGTFALILKSGVGWHHMEPGTGLIWLGHGWLFLVYVLATARLGLKMRWHPLKHIVVMVAGMIPTASFIAEHFINKETRAALATG
jgi:integral membrane protein